jgi:flagellar biogenesis protein FliO
MHSRWQSIFRFVIVIVATTSVRIGTATAAPATTAPATREPVAGVFEKTSIHRTVAPASASPRGKAAVPAGNLWDMQKIPLALGAVILLILAMRIVGKKMMAGGGAFKSSEVLSVILRSSVSPRQQLMLVKVGRRLVLVGTGGNDLSALCQIDDPNEVAELLGQIRAEKTASPASNFRAMFGKAGNAYEPGDEPDEIEEQPASALGAAGGKDLSGITDRIRRISEKFQKSQVE